MNLKTKNFSISSRYDKVTGISDAINLYMTEHQVPKEIADMFEICLLEALNNIIKHAYKEDFSKKIEITVNISPYKTIVKLSDTGIPRKNIKKAKLEFDPTDIEQLPEGGMGLYIIENLMDEANYCSENSVNTFELIKYL